MLNYISLFSSAGIGCYGFLENNFKCVATNELLEKRLNIQKINNKCKYQSGYILGDLSNENIKKQLLDEISFWKKKEKMKEIDVLIATPPCQGMSVANLKKNNELKRNSLIVESIKLINEINPKIFIFENVRSFLNSLCDDLDGKTKKIKNSIEENLLNYKIETKILDFSKFGVPTKRTRTIVIGVRNDIENISPYDLFPEENKEKTLKEAIGSLKELKNMGEIDNKDFLHFFRKYPIKMREWIKDLNEGESAFSNKENEKKPHKIINGKLVLNKNKTGDKYKRCFWDKTGYCIHTRNDQLASQWTIHPKDDRVFSIRELMKMMTIPSNFKWFEKNENEINILSLNEKEKILKKNEFNIRQNIGEAVPTIIFKKIASNIKKKLEEKIISEKELNLIIKENKLSNISNLKKYISENKDKLPISELLKIAEFSNSKRLENSAYYTPSWITFNLVKEFPNFENKNKISLLEPSAGCGNFLLDIFNKYENIKEVNLDLIDIDKNSLEILKIIVSKMKVSKNFKINFIHENYLEHKFNKKYDLIFGNPPFKKLDDKEEVKKYKEFSKNKKTNNIFSFFIEKSLPNTKYLSFITPKSLLSTPEFNKTREIINNKNILNIFDFGQKGFKIKIETISFLLNEEKLNEKNSIKIFSYLKDEIFNLEQKKLNKFPSWVLYQNLEFERISKKLKFDNFKVFRDREISKKHIQKKGKTKILRARNLINHKEIKDIIPNYNGFIDEEILEKLQVKKYLNKKVLIAPNLSYYPRVSFLPKNSIVDGSLALLIPKNDDSISEEQLSYFESEEFREFYKMARNFGTRSLNIDSNSVYFWGIKQ